MTVDSGERHSHAESGYNERRAECEAACRELGVETLSDAADDAELPGALGRRLRHVRTENARVEETVAALRARRPGARRRAARRLAREPARRLRGVHRRRWSATVTALRDAGAAGARMVGGGFGGHVLALLRPGVTAPQGALRVRPSAGARRLG